jgi:hypothetical protein
MKVINRKQWDAIHQMVEHHWDWDCPLDYGYFKTEFQCALYCDKSTNTIKLKTISPGRHFDIKDFGKLNEYHPMEILDREWHMLKVGYDLFLEEMKLREFYKGL